MKRVAGIDCGTNSIRLLIADLSDAGLREVVRTMEIVRLGAGVDRTGILDEAALERTFAAAERYAHLCRDHEVSDIRFVATSATRDAQNREVFVSGIRQRLGVEPEVVSGLEEAHLSFIGALSHQRERSETTLVVDIGGGSSELVLGAGDVLAQYSMNIGCVRMTERHFHTDPPTAKEIAAASADIDRALDVAERVVDLSKAEALVGLAGSVTTITAAALELPSYQPAAIDGTYLSVEEITAQCHALLHATRAERASYGFMHAGRVDVIGAGALIWQRIVARVAARSTTVRGAITSEHDILDGIALSLRD
ncbi:MAG: Ppx/GppA phosphatase family protein [Bowdeniella nasicola]|nr:Ppx/GppA phosphatase family protein [Bowdeniella nasicola]